MAKKFDVVVYDLGDNGTRMNPQPQNGIMAPSRNDIVAMFEECGQQVEILREYEDEQSKNYGKFDPNKLQTNYQQGGELNCKAHMETNLPKEIMDAVLHPQSNANPQQKPEVPQNAVTTPQKQVVKVQEPVKYFTVGGLKCKIDNGKVYQKQWIRLSEDEMAEFRIVADKTNKICPLKDKHVEMLKWVIAEDSNETETKEKEIVLG